MLKIIIALTAASVGLSAADLHLGTWKANISKSKYSPGPAPKSVTTTYTKDGDWVTLKNETVQADGKSTSNTNRYKRDGKEHPWKSPNGEKGTIAIKASSDYVTDGVLKVAGRTTTVHTVLSKDGKTRTQTSRGKNADGKDFEAVVLFEKQ